MVIAVATLFPALHAACRVVDAEAVVAYHRYCALEENLRTWPLDKTSRWLGYVQGVMAAEGMPSVREERDFSRPMFHAAYAAAGVALPATAESPPGART